MRHAQPTIEELARAVPKRCTGVPVRCLSHKEAVLALLRQRAECGGSVLGSELYAEPVRFGRSPRNRISELRKDGHLIEGKAHGGSDWEYRLIREANPPKVDWYEERFGNRPKKDSRSVTDGSMLFAEVSR